jgi:hypothetical protein
MDNKRTAVSEAATRLARILDKPEHGLASWHMMAERAYQDLLRAAAVEEKEPS